MFGVRNSMTLTTGSMTCVLPYDMYAQANNSISIYNHTGSNTPQSGVHAYTVTNGVATASVYSNGGSANVSSSSSIWVWWR